MDRRNKMKQHRKKQKKKQTELDNANGKRIKRENIEITKKKKTQNKNRSVVELLYTTQQFVHYFFFIFFNFILGVCSALLHCISAVFMVFIKTEISFLINNAAEKTRQENK